MTNPFPNNPLFSSLREAHKAFVRNNNALDVNVDQLSDIVEHHRYNGHPDDECAYESDLREELEIALMNATFLQEKLEDLATTMSECATWEARHKEAYTEYHKLVSRYSK